MEGELAIVGLVILQPVSGVSAFLLRF